MSQTAPSHPPLDPSTDWKTFVAQICAALEIDVVEQDADTWELTLPEELAERWKVIPQVGRFIANGTPVESGGESLESDGDLFRLALKTLEDQRRVLHLSPVEQAVRVTDISDKILSAYEVDNGQKRLAGCTIEDRPILRVSYLDNNELLHLHFLADGRPVDDELSDYLKLDHVLPHERQREWGTIDDVVYRWIETAQSQSDRNGFLVASMVWCKYAIGKVELSVEESSVQVGFEGWSTLLADGTLVAPPYTCPDTNIDSYHLAMDDEGHLTGVEALARCADTGQCLIATRMTTCSDTKITALDQFFEACAATGERVHHSAISDCSVCRQNVRINQLYHQMCPTCRSLKTVRKVDPAIARILGEYPQLDQWKKWRISEGNTCCVLVGSRLFQRVLLVMDREDLQILRAARGSRFSRTWTDVEFDEL